MNEWMVVTVVIALVGFVIAIVTPIIKLNTTITKLALSVDYLRDDLAELTGKNSDSHQKLWDKNAEQDTVLTRHEMCINDHEKRIMRAEEKIR